MYQEGQRTGATADRAQLDVSTMLLTLDSKLNIPPLVRLNTDGRYQRMRRSPMSRMMLAPS